MRLRHLSVLALLVAPGSLFAQSRPDFSGSWVLDAAKSGATGNMAPPTAGTQTVVQKGDTISTESQTAGDAGMALKRYYVVDGKAYKNGLSYQGTDMVLSSTLSWGTGALKIQTVTDYAGTPVEQAEVWTLTDGGKTLTQSTTTSVNGEVWATLTLVFNKK